MCLSVCLFVLFFGFFVLFCFLFFASFVIRRKTIVLRRFSFHLVLCHEYSALWPVRIFSLVSNIWKVHVPLCIWWSFRETGILISYSQLVRSTGNNVGLQLASLHLPVPALRGVCHKGSQFVETSVVSIYIALSVLALLTTYAAKDFRLLWGLRVSCLDLVKATSFELSCSNASCIHG